MTPPPAVVSAVAKSSSDSQTPLPLPLTAETLAGDYIGFIGCDQVGLLPVRMAANRRVLRVTCPRCGELHTTTDPMPRLRRPGEIVTLVEDGMPI